ncbi:DinB family protein [Anseongella ginsenosidimutans]|uniref:DinB family protein n=1 Tax=Anseongella ginsenosidimutans TaxID=496056 RepID=A0A4R3KTB4_9SPHI|nr:DinB family protein [Anseongella ginsenosidimutans]QEC53233.1 DinB family protein [Anseongella ginsenosidimutans]TCS87869.1 DinB family protein [Anseongella ginsenosidimutans]
MKKSAIQIDPGYFSRYINVAGDGELYEELDKSLRVLDELDIKALERVGDQVYAPGKWSLKTIFQHMIDTERIFQYRALRFARNDLTPLHGFEQDDYAKQAGEEGKDLAGLLEELKIVRRAGILLFRGLSSEALQRAGIASGNELSVLAIGFLIVGHQIHHLNIIRSKYLPLGGRD